MKAPKKIILREDIVEELLHLRKPGMALSGDIKEMIEHEKKRRLLDDIRRIQEREELVELF
ncbi:hypothetical protein [Methanocalculus sp.]|uniref:hypothetical protein n=1 Tax=Methanocalculus sp. TaxID=2004547 RepID=UPI00262B120C|nr:hypothetical protein [Methanocalculus sp.]MDG6250577.1 hypothetical protein [Methanocalculus sp.]